MCYALKRSIHVCTYKCVNSGVAIGVVYWCFDAFLPSRSNIWTPADDDDVILHVYEFNGNNSINHAA
jgi:hypothetical protein